MSKGTPAYLQIDTLERILKERDEQVECLEAANELLQRTISSWKDLAEKRNERIIELLEERLRETRISKE